MKRTLPLVLAAFAGLPIGLSSVSAHVSVGGDRTFDGDPLTAPPLLEPIDGGTYTVTSQFVTTNSGWADGTDDNWGDSHHTRQFKFTLASTQTVTIAVARNDSIFQSGPTGTFLPAFTLFTTPQFRLSTHDFSIATRAYLTASFGTGAVGESFADANTNMIWDVGESFTDANGNGIYDSAGVDGSGKEGAFRALAPWTIYVDTPTVANRLPMFFETVGHAADGNSTNYGSAPGIDGDNNADGMVTATFSHLSAGEYYLFVGGANYLAQNTEGATYGPLSNALPNYGIDVTVTAVPEPSSCALLALGAAGLTRLRGSRRRATNTQPDRSSRTLP